MTTVVDLHQFASLFEIGFALHFAVAFLDRIYAKELPERIKKIGARAKSLEQLKKEITQGATSQEQGVETAELKFAYRAINQPVWNTYNNQVLDRVYALALDTKELMRALRRILNVITFLSILVLLYTVTILFMVGLELEYVKGLSPVVASAIVLMQLLPLPIAAVVFFFVSRRMSQKVDRKIRGVGELQLMLSPPDSSTGGYASVEQVYQRDRERNRYMDDD